MAKLKNSIFPIKQGNIFHAFRVRTVYVAFK